MLHDRYAPQVRWYLWDAKLCLSQNWSGNRWRRNRHTCSLGYRILRCKVQCLRYLETTAIQAILTSKTVKILAVYLTPTRNLIDSDMSDCPAGRHMFLLVSDLNAKHVGWNFRLIKTKSRFWYVYANENSFLI
jgi:hypothetical protein